MSILDALRVQRSGQKSVQELAQLPQQQIMQMAQMGQIPADVVPVIISEKARLAQQAAQAQANPHPPSVMDQAMQVNAQHEQQGLPAIPTPGMFKEQNYQTGGIVGYAGPEGSVVAADELTPYINRQPQEARPDFATAVRQAQALMAPHLQQSEAEKSYASMLRAPPADENKMMWMSLLRGGLKTLGGSSPYAGVNLGQGLGEAAQSYEEGLKEQQKQKLAYAKEMADQAKSQRQEGLAALTLGQRVYSDEATLQASLARAAKEGDMNSYARTYAVAARERGDSRSDTQLLQEGAQEYVKLRGGLEARLMQAGAAQTGAAAATSQAVTAGERVRTDAEIRRDEAQSKREEAQRTAEIRRDELERKKADENDKNRRDAVKNVNARISEPSTDLRRRMRKEGEAKVRAELMQEELGVYGLGAQKPALPPGFNSPSSGQPKLAPPPNFQIVK
jgi:hypothetical protein